MPALAFPPGTQSQHENKPGPTHSGSRTKERGEASLPEIRPSEPTTGKSVPSVYGPQTRQKNQEVNLAKISRAL